MAFIAAMHHMFSNQAALHRALGAPTLAVGACYLRRDSKGAIRALLGCAGRWMGMHVKSSLGLSLVLSVMLMSAMNLGSGCIWNHTHMPGLVVATTL
jgi:hypothetical protein